MSAEENSSAEPAGIGEALVAALGFEPAEGRKLGRKAGSSATDNSSVQIDTGAPVDDANEMSTVDDSLSVATADGGSTSGVLPASESANGTSRPAADGPDTGTDGANRPAQASSTTKTSTQNGSASARARKQRNRNRNRKPNRSGNKSTNGGPRPTGETPIVPSADKPGLAETGSGAEKSSSAHDEIKSAAQPVVTTPAAPQPPSGSPSAQADSSKSGRDGSSATPADNQADKSTSTRAAAAAAATGAGSAADPAQADPVMAPATAVTGDIEDLLDTAPNQPPPPTAEDVISLDEQQRSAAIADAAAAVTIPAAPPAKPRATPAQSAEIAAAVPVTAESATVAEGRLAEARVETRSSPSPAMTEQILVTKAERGSNQSPTVVRVATKPDTPGLAQVRHMLRRKRRVQARKVRRVIRHIDPWSVLTFSVLFHLCVFAALLLASVLVWNAADAAGTIENLETFILDLGDYETFEIKGEVVFRAAVAIAGILTLASSVLLVLLTVVFNLISDLVGGIRLTVIEEETVRVRRKKTPA